MASSVSTLVNLSGFVSNSNKNVSEQRNRRPQEENGDVEDERRRRKQEEVIQLSHMALIHLFQPLPVHPYPQFPGSRTCVNPPAEGSRVLK